VIVKIYDTFVSRPQADVLVNSIGSNVDLSAGQLSSSLLRAAGPQLQAECTQNAPQDVKAGNIIITSGYQLPCKQVYHSCCPYYNGSPMVNEFSSNLL